MIIDPPYQVGDIAITRWLADQATYETDTGATIYSGADEPSLDDASDCIQNPRTMPSPVATPAQIAAYRWQVENGGVSVAIGGTPYRFDTTRENRATWLALRMEAQGNPAIVQPWKTLEGTFIQLSAADVLTVCEAVYMHVAVCFSIEEALLSNPPTVAELLNAGWPA